ncbi:MAG TPA: DUF4150 domain-containing protein [Anaeromyxobacter sp.]|nr:DUF4150 domain-containing protein [Anaeromyxobacter sp.]
MPTTVGVNGLSIVHKDSGGTVSFMPDVCLTPQPSGPPVPIPYPNSALSIDADLGARTVTCDGNPILVQGSTFRQSAGDEAGAAGGVTSGCTKGAAEFVAYSFDVQAEGKGVARFSDLMVGNKSAAANTPSAPEQQAPAPAAREVAPGELQPDRLTVLVTDGAGNPLADVHYVLETPDGRSVEGNTDGAGKIVVDETVTGIGRITFPDHPEISVEVLEG